MLWKKHWNILSADDIGKEIFNSLPLFSFSRAKSVWDILVQADTHKNSISQGRLDNATGFFPYQNCAACSSSKKVNMFTSFATKKEHKI